MLAHYDALERQPSAYTAIARDFQAVIQELQHEVDSLRLRLADKNATIKQLRERNAELLKAAQDVVLAPPPKPDGPPPSLTLNTTTRALTVDGRTAYLSGRECQVVEILYRRRGEALTYLELQQAVFGRMARGGHEGGGLGHTVAQTLVRLRHKLRKAGIPADVVCQRVGSPAAGLVLMPAEAA